MATAAPASAADPHAPEPGAVAIAVKAAPEVLHGRQAAVPDAPAVRKPTAPHKPTAHPVVASAEPQPRPAIQSSDPYVELKTAIKRYPIAFDPGVDGKADAATEIAKLKKIAYSTVGPDASLALYKIAVLLYRPLMQDAEALRTLDIYRGRFARGKELDAALWLRVRIVCGRTLDDTCRKAAYSYEQSVTGQAVDIAIRITNAQ